MLCQNGKVNAMGFMFMSLLVYESLYKIASETQELKLNKTRSIHIINKFSILE